MIGVTGRTNYQRLIAVPKAVPARSRAALHPASITQALWQSSQRRVTGDTDLARQFMI